MKTAICPGSFDPVTNGHIDIITRTAALFDSVVVLVLENPKKASLFSKEERIDLLEKSVIGLENVTFDSYNGLLADYAKKIGCISIVKGLRALSDFDNEFQMALANKSLYPEAETIFLPTRAENMFLSSSMVKQISNYGGDISQFVPPQIVYEVNERIKRSNKD